MPYASHVVMFDGKKITPDSADIYLMDKEEEPKLTEVRESQDRKLKRLQLRLTKRNTDQTIFGECPL